MAIRTRDSYSYGLCSYGNPHTGLAPRTPFAPQARMHAVGRTSADAMRAVEERVHTPCPFARGRTYMRIELRVKHACELVCRRVNEPVYGLVCRRARSDVCQRVWRPGHACAYPCLLVREHTFCVLCSHVNRHFFFLCSHVSTRLVFLCSHVNTHCVFVLAGVRPWLRLHGQGRP